MKQCGPSQNYNFEKVPKNHSKLMGPEEIHIYLWEGAPCQPKRKCDRSRNLEGFLVNFQIRYLALVFPFVQTRNRAGSEKILGGWIWE